MQKSDDLRILAPHSENLDRAAQMLLAGEIVGIPTETVYGLGALAKNETACQKIFAAKGRPQDNPLIVHILNVDEIEQFALNPPKEAYKLAASFWPGPLTIILRDNGVLPKTVTANTNKIALRVPAHSVMRDLLQMLGEPIAAPSANLSGRPSPTQAAHVAHDFPPQTLGMILDGGPCDFGLESTIVDLTPLEKWEPALIVRLGSTNIEDLQKILPNAQIISKITSQLTVSPGLKYRHYAPSSPLIIVNGEEDHRRQKIVEYIEKSPATTTARLAIITSTENAHFYQSKNCNIFPLAGKNETDVAAKNFFHMLRLIDQTSPTNIICEIWPEQGIGKALRNRMFKAATKII